MDAPRAASRAGRTSRASALALLIVLAVNVLVVGAATAAPTPAPQPVPAPGPPLPSQLPGIYGPGLSPDSSVAPPSGPVPGDDVPAQKDPGFFDIPGQIEQAIDEWFGHLVKLALDPVLRLIGTTLLSAPNLSDGRVAQIWDGTLITANTLYVLFVLVGAMTVMGRETVQSSYSVKEIAPRILIGAVASNASLWVISQIVALGNALSAALMTGSVSAQGVGSVLTSSLFDNAMFFGSGDLFLLLIGLAIAVLGVVLLIMYLVRSAVLVILTVGAPLAFACHALPFTEGLAKLWWRAIFGCVAIQVVQALVLITGIQIFFDPQATNIIGLPTGGGLIDLLVCLCLFVVMLKVPAWVQRIVMGRSPFRPSRLSRMASTYVFFRAWGLLRPGGRPPGRSGWPGTAWSGSGGRGPRPPFLGGSARPRPGGSGPGGLGGWRPAPTSMTATQQQRPAEPGTPPPSARQSLPASRSLPPPGPIRSPRALPPGRSTRLDRSHQATVANPPARGDQQPLFPAPERPPPSASRRPRSAAPARRDPTPKDRGT